MFIFNPKNAVTVRNIWIYDKFYFSSKLEEEFKPGDVIQIDDKVGAYLIELIGFLEEVSAVKAEQIVKEQKVEKFVCDHEGCNFEAKSPFGLQSHKRSHASDVEGVRKVVPMETESRPVPKEDSQQKTIEEEAKETGLLGGELVQS